MNETVLKENKMGVLPVGRLLANMAIPMMISMLVQAFYNIFKNPLCIYTKWSKRLLPGSLKNSCTYIY